MRSNNIAYTYVYKLIVYAKTREKEIEGDKQYEKDTNLA